MYRVEGFDFETKEEALQAKKEVEGVRYIKEQMLCCFCVKKEVFVHKCHSFLLF